MGNMIDVDVTLFIQLVNFLITLVALNFMLIKPVRGQIAARGALTSGYIADIEQFNADAAKQLGWYETALASTREKASVTREALNAEGQAQEQALLQAAQAQTQAYLQSSRKKTAEEALKTKNALLSQVDDYAAKAVDRILG